MLYYQELVYNYTRLKTIEHTDGKDILFLYVELSISKVQALGSKKRHKEDTVISEIVRIPLENAPDVYNQLPDGDYFLELSKDVFEKLKQLAEEDFESFASYTE